MNEQRKLVGPLTHPLYLSLERKGGNPILTGSMAGTMSSGSWIYLRTSIPEEGRKPALLQTGWELQTIHLHIKMVI